MANEATKVELYGPNADGEPRSMTCSSSVAITKGTLLAMSTPRTVAAHASLGQVFGGIAAMDKDSADTSTTISVYTNGVFTCAASSTITCGDQVILSSYPNYVESSNVIAVNPGGKLVGIALSTASSSLVDVRVLI